MSKENPYEQNTTATKRRDLGLWGVPWVQGQRGGPHLVPSPSNNRPGFTVWMSDPDEEGKDIARRPVNVRMNMNEWVAFREMADLFLTGKHGTISFVGKIKSSDPSVSKPVDDVKVGMRRNEEGLVTLVVQKIGRRPAVFVFNNSYWASFFADAEILSPSMLSTILARSWLKNVDMCFMHDLTAGHIDEAELAKIVEERRNNNGSGYNNGGGYNSAPPSDYDNDLPS